MSAEGGDAGLPAPTDLDGALRQLHVLEADLAASRARCADLRAQRDATLDEVEAVRWGACAGFGALVRLRDDLGLSEAGRQLAAETIAEIQSADVSAPETRAGWYAWATAYAFGFLADLVTDLGVPEPVRARARDTVAEAYAHWPPSEPEAAAT